MIAGRVYDLITDDLYLRLPEFIGESNVLLKVEGLNPAGSIKLKTALALITDAEERGLLKPRGRVVESSSGNLGIALSMVCAVRGYSFTCITDPKASPHSVAAMRALSAEVIVVTEPDANGGYLGTRIALIKEMLRADPELTWPNQYGNVANSRAHWERTATEILQAIPSVEYLFVGAGTTGTLMGCAGYFRKFSPLTRIIAVDSRGSVTFGQPAGPRYVPGLGTSRLPELCRTDNLDEIVLIEEADAVRMCRRVAGEFGLLVGGSTGSVLAAVDQLGDQIPDGATVVAISPDLGDHYLDSVYDDDWVAERFGADVLAEPSAPIRRVMGAPLAEPRVPIRRMVGASLADSELATAMATVSYLQTQTSSVRFSQL
jgi:N-(2-amino-2-carboxyethyl)-L-glutamate synthase